MDECGGLTLNSPEFFVLLQRQYLALAGVQLRERLLFPKTNINCKRTLLAVCEKCG